MKACDENVLIKCPYTIIYVLLSLCATFCKNTPDTIGTDKIELRPIFVSAGIGDIIIISAPIIVNNNNRNNIVVYYLSDPNGNSKKLNISDIWTDYKETFRNNYATSSDNGIKYIEGKMKSVIATKRDRVILNFIDEKNCIDTDADEKYDFTIGPAGEPEHGNWVLSAHLTTHDGGRYELFQVITIEIVESLATSSKNVKLLSGQTFEPRFLYPINYLRACEINAPPSTFDRFYDRDSIHMDYCGFRIPNVTKNDEGTWGIIGVGNVVYKGDVYLDVDDD